MLKEKQEKLEKESEAVQEQNFKLKSMVEMSRIEVYEEAVTERDAALELVENMEVKVNAIQENTKVRIAIINKDAKKGCEGYERKNKILAVDFWRNVVDRYITWKSNMICKIDLKMVEIHLKIISQNRAFLIISGGCNNLPFCLLLFFIKYWRINGF